MTTRRFSMVIDLPTHRNGDIFSARGPRGTIDLDPFINVDLFQMTGPVFAPHPHAGFSAVTYMFDDSTTRFRNRDSLGDDSLIEPGGVHWTVAGSGIMHEEVVEETGRVGHGAQIFVRLPPDAEERTPYGMHFGPNDLPLLTSAAGSRLRIVSGQSAGERSPVHEAANAHVYDLELGPQGFIELPVQPAMRGFVMTVRGAAILRVDSGEARLGPTGLAVFEPGNCAITIMAGQEGAQMLIGSGIPMRIPAHMHGGFCLSSPERVKGAIERYQRGEMRGALHEQLGRHSRDAPTRARVRH